MTASEYESSVTEESQAVFEASFAMRMAMGASFDSAMQGAIEDELRHIEARKGKEA